MEKSVLSQSFDRSEEPNDPDACFKQSRSYATVFLIAEIM